MDFMQKLENSTLATFDVTDTTLLEEKFLTVVRIGDTPILITGDGDKRSVEEAIKIVQSAGIREVAEMLHLEGTPNTTMIESGELDDDVVGICDRDPNTGKMGDFRWIALSTFRETAFRVAAVLCANEDIQELAKMSKIVLISNFNGASIAQLALYENENVEVVDVYTTEVDKFALKHEIDAFPNNRQLGDISDVDWSRVKREIEYNHGADVKIFVAGGFPCQSLSTQGSRIGLEANSYDEYLDLLSQGEEFKGTSYLFFELVRCIKEIEPDYFFVENVKAKNSVIADISVELGVGAKLINSSLVSAQNRERYYWANFNLPIPSDKGIELRDILDNEEFGPLPKWLTDGTNWKNIMSVRTVESSKSSTLTTNKTHSIHFLSNEDRTGGRWLNVDEWERLQTFPKGWSGKGGLSNTQRHKLIGNSWTLDLIIELFKNIK